jgi:hypothetical protein
MVVRLGLEADALFVVKFYDAGVVAENAHAPVVGPEPLANYPRRREDRFLEHALELNFARLRIPLVAIMNAAAERFVRAMLAPRLGDRFQFDVGRRFAFAK